MTDEAMSPLRRRIIKDMTIREITPKTQQGYRTVKDSNDETRAIGDAVIILTSASASRFLKSSTIGSCDAGQRLS